MNIKKIIIIAVIVVIAILPFAISAFDKSNEEPVNTLKSDIFDFHEDLRVKYRSAKSESELKDIIYNFCKSKGFNVLDIGNGNLSFELKATEGFKDAKSSTLHLGYSIENKNKTSQTAAIAVATLKNSTNHGKINVLITPENSKATTNVSKISKDYLNTDNFINLTHWEKNAIFNGSATTKEYTMTKAVNHISPNGNKAYEIKISNLNNTDSGNRTEKHTNPIVFIGDILASAKASGIVIDIASFTGGDNITTYPTDAKAVVVIDESSEKKFLNKLESSHTAFKDKNRNRDEDATYSYKEVDLPNQVLSLNDTSKLLSLLYTLVDGVYATTEEDYEGDVLSYTTIASIDTSSNIKLKALARSIDQLVIKDMDTAFKTTSNLSDFSMKSTNRYPLWEANLSGKDKDIQSEYTKSVTSAFEGHNIKTTPRYNFVESDCSVFKKMNPKLEMISIGVNIENAYDQASALTTLFQNMKPADK